MDVNIKDLVEKNITYLNKQLEEGQANEYVIFRYIACFRNILTMDFFLKRKVETKFFLDYLFSEAKNTNVELIDWKEFRKQKIDIIINDIK